jgi:hypothetical protein
LNPYCFDHGDVTWDNSKGKSFGKQKSLLDREFWGRLGQDVGTC